MGSHLHDLLAASLATTPQPSRIHFQTTWKNCPEEGETFDALTMFGVVVRLEANADATVFHGQLQDYTRADLVGWWRDPPLDPALSERQQVVADHYEEAFWDRQNGREEDQ